MEQISLAALLLLAACSQSSENAKADGPAITALPDFAAYTDVKQKKQAFFDFMRPIVQAENAKVAMSREKMQGLAATLKQGGTLSDDERSWLAQLATTYHVKMPSINDEKAWATLMLRVDVVPFRLALAQSANESSWGTSRFAREGRNFFGQWCFTPGCGIVPAHRTEGMTHEVATYHSVHESVASYIRRLNYVAVYAPLRKLRGSLRQAGKPVTAVDLAQGLLGYSERGLAYVSEIQSMIRVNYKLMSPSEVALEKQATPNI